jgi:hypothetical protein
MMYRLHISDLITALFIQEIICDYKYEYYYYHHQEQPAVITAVKTEVHMFDPHLENGCDFRRH